MIVLLNGLTDHIFEGTVHPLYYTARLGVVSNVELLLYPEQFHYALHYLGSEVSALVQVDAAGKAPPSEYVLH